jgi:hypothetical protein
MSISTLCLAWEYVVTVAVGFLCVRSGLPRTCWSDSRFESRVVCQEENSTKIRGASDSDAQVLRNRRLDSISEGTNQSNSNSQTDRYS